MTERNQCQKRMLRQQAASRQRGASLLRGLLLLVIIILLGRMAIVTVPAYYDYYTAKTAITNALDDTALVARGASALKTSLRKRFDINNIETIGAEGLDIRTVDGHLQVKLDYTVKKPLFYNVSLLMHFKHNFDKPVVAN